MNQFNHSGYYLLCQNNNRNLMTQLKLTQESNELRYIISKTKIHELRKELQKKNRKFIYLNILKAENTKLRDADPTTIVALI